MSVVVERNIIGIFGCMNVGKSSVLNLIVQQEASIVDATPGTTADTKEVLCEIHGIGPVKLLDTAGFDEEGMLGQKKRKKVYDNLKECDCVLLIIDPSRENFLYEESFIKNAREQSKQILIVFNIFDNTNPEKIENIADKLPVLKFFPWIQIKATDEVYRNNLIQFIISHFTPKTKDTPLIPFLKKDHFYVLIIPMDEETPKGRYLRPQAMVEEYITRNWAYPVSYRLNLTKARGTEEEKKEEYERFTKFLSSLKQKPHCIFTDSQAIDVIGLWCPDDIMLTTFSIVMIHYQSNGKLHKFVNAVKTIDSLPKNSMVLIAEACNHNRIAEDIGTVQIPRILKNKYPGLRVEHSFGKIFMDIEQIKQYSLIIHCGGCMISRQALQARMRDYDIADVPYTNYGIFLSYIQGEKIFKKVLSPWMLM
ncbi:MAG: GTP-binding protein [Spirochaetes bacterium]|nr:GTP-binding protein [Spirochaetota bacterium]